MIDIFRNKGLKFVFIVYLEQSYLELVYQGWKFFKQGCCIVSFEGYYLYCNFVIVIFGVVQLCSVNFGIEVCSLMFYLQVKEL